MKYFLILILLFPLVTLGSGTDVEQEVELVTGDVSLIGGESKAIGFGRSSFDVDINQCMGSTAWDTIIGGKQKLVLNWVCLAEFYLKTGQPDLAAVAICNTEMLNEFSSEAECEGAHDFFVEVAEAMVVDDSHFEEEEEWHEEQMQMQSDYDARIDRLEEQIEQRPTRTIVEKQSPWMTDEKRAKLEAVLAE